MYPQQYDVAQLMVAKMSQLLQQFVLPNMLQQQRMHQNELQFVTNTLQSGMLQQLAGTLTQPTMGMDTYGRQMQMAPRQYSDQELCQILWEQVNTILNYGRQNNTVPQLVTPPAFGMGQQPMYGQQAAPQMIYPSNGMGGAMQQQPQQVMYGQGMMSPMGSPQSCNSPLSNLYGNGSMDSGGGMVYPTNITPSIEIHSNIPTVVEQSQYQPAQTTTAADIAQATNTSQYAISQQRCAPTTGDAPLVSGVERSAAAGASVLDAGLGADVMPEFVVSATRQPTNQQMESRKEMLTSGDVQLCTDIATYNTSAGHDVLVTQLDLRCPYSNWYLAKKDLYSSTMTPRMESFGVHYVNIISYQEMTPFYRSYDDCKYDLDRLAEARKVIGANLSKSGTFITMLKSIRHQDLASILIQRFVDTFNDMARVWLLLGDDTYNSTFVSISEPDDIFTLIAPAEQRIPELKIFTEQDDIVWYNHLIRCVFAAINAVCLANTKCYLDMDQLDEQLIALSAEESGIRYQGMNGRQIAHNYDVEEGIPTEVVSQLKRRIVILQEATVLHTRLDTTSGVVQLQPDEAISYEQPRCALDQIILDYFKTSPNRSKLTMDFSESVAIGRDDITVGKTLNGRIAYYRRKAQ